MIPTLPFGSTGHQSARLIFGAAALARASQAEADAGLERLCAAGLNHIDVAASYGDAEVRLAPWLRSHRAEVFLASKTGERDYAGAREQLRRSLERLGVEQLDLIQLHNLVKPEEHERAFAEDGALRALVEARDEGLVRFIGVTGHGTRVAGMHLESLHLFPFDSVLLPYNYAMLQNSEYAADFARLLEVCRERGVAGPRGRSPRTRPGTSPSEIRRTSSAPSTGRSRAPASSSTPRAISRSSGRWSARSSPTRRRQAKARCASTVRVSTWSHCS